MDKKRKKRTSLLERIAMAHQATKMAPLPVLREEEQELIHKLSTLGALYQLGLEEGVPAAKEIGKDVFQVLRDLDDQDLEKLSRVKSELLLKYTVQELKRRRSKSN